MANKTLSDKQMKAIDLIIQGESLTDIAKIVGVSRTTVSTWKNQDELFKAELDKSIQALKSGVDTQIVNNINPLMDRLIKIALKSSSDKTSLDAIIYALNRVLGTPTNKTQEVAENDNKKEIIDIDKMLESIREKSGNN